MIESNEQRLLSVIIPYYNGFEYIEKNVAQLLQIHALKEIIVVDDGSTEEGYDELITVFHDERVKIFQKENGGIAEARNYGLERATGRYITFVDQDDLIVPETYDLGIADLFENQSNCLLWTTKFFSENEEGIICNIKRDAIICKELILSELLPTLLYNRPNDYLTCLGQVWGGIYDSNFINRHNICFQKIVNYEDDFLFVLKVLLKASSISLIHDVAYYWRIREKSFSHTAHFVDDYVIKNQKLRDYIMTSMIDADVDTDFVSDYRIWFNQKMPIEAMINMCKKNEKVNNICNFSKEILSCSDYCNAYLFDCRLSGRFYSVMFTLLKRHWHFTSALVGKICYSINRN